MTPWFALLAIAHGQEIDKQGAPAPDVSKVSVSLTDDFELRYYVKDDRLPDPDDVAVFNYVEQVNRLNATIGVGPWNFEAQVDEVALFANQYFLDGEPHVERDLLFDPMFAPFATDNPGELNRFGYATLEKIRARVETDHYNLTFGDAYAAFGRGIALNMNRNVDIDIDTSIQGFKGLFRPGAWDVTLVAGQLNRQQVFQDNPNVALVGDRRHAVAGLRVERFGLGPANLGAHVVTYDFVSTPGWWTEPVTFAQEEQNRGDNAGVEELFTPVDVVIGGLTGELTGVGGVDWYVEGDVFGYPTDTVPNTLITERSERFFTYGTALRPQDVGYATYLSAAFYPGKTTWLVEFKRYYQAERVNGLLATDQYEVAVAPTLEYERATNEDTSAAINSNDITGGRVRMDIAAAPGVIPYLSFAAYRDEDLSTLHFNKTPETVLTPFTGIEWIEDESAVLANAGYRVDLRDRDDTVANCTDANAFLCDPGHDAQLWVDASVKFPVGGGLHGEVQGSFETWHWGVNELQQQDFVEATTGITVQKGSDLAVTLYNDLSTDPLVLRASEGNWPVEVDEERPFFGAVEVQVKPTTALTVKAFYGAYKSGIRCAGGQCRQLPGFEGARIGVQGAF